MLVLIPISETERRTGYCRQHLSRLEKRGLFPRRVALSTGRVGHVESEVEDWIATKIKARDAGTAPAVNSPSRPDKAT